MIVLVYPKCTTCKKALAWLEEHSIPYEARHIVEQNPTEDELRQWHAESGLPLKRFFNTSGMNYRALGLKDKLPQMSEDEQYALLASDGMLVRRPLVIGENMVLCGFKQKEWEASFHAE